MDSGLDRVTSQLETEMNSPDKNSRSKRVSLPKIQHKNSRAKLERTSRLSIPLNEQTESLSFEDIFSLGYGGVPTTAFTGDEDEGKRQRKVKFLPYAEHRKRNPMVKKRSFSLDDLTLDEFEVDSGHGDDRSGSLDDIKPKSILPDINGGKQRSKSSIDTSHLSVSNISSQQRCNSYDNLRNINSSTTKEIGGLRNHELRSCSSWNDIRCKDEQNPSAPVAYRRSSSGITPKLPSGCQSPPPAKLPPIPTINIDPGDSRPRNKKASADKRDYCVRLENPKAVIEEAIMKRKGFCPTNMKLNKNKGGEKQPGASADEKSLNGDSSDDEIHKQSTRKSSVRSPLAVPSSPNFQEAYYST